MAVLMARSYFTCEVRMKICICDIHLGTNLITHLSFFQCTFAATCVTIVSGAIAERCNFNGYIIFCVIVTGVTYPIGAHWCWGPGGWLGDLGFRDFAGSAVVHLSGGICALVGMKNIYQNY